MKYCQDCGAMNADSARGCRKCGSFFSMDGRGYYSRDDETSVGLCILSFFFPIFAMFYCAVKGTEKPRCAKGCAVAAVVSWAVGVVFWIIFVCIFYAAILSMLMMM